MNNKNILIIIFCYTLSQIGFGIDYSKDKDFKWIETTTRKNITIWEGSKNLKDFIPVKGEITINAPIEQVLAVLDDTSNKHHWLTALKYVNIIKQENDLLKYEFYEVNMPLLISNRSFVLEVKAQIIDNKTVKAYIKSKDSLKEKNPDLVRATLGASTMTITSLNPLQTKVTGEFFTNPNGLIPDFVVRQFTRVLAMESMEKFKNFILNQRYSLETLSHYNALLQRPENSNGQKKRNVASDK